MAYRNDQDNNNKIDHTYFEQQKKCKDVSFWICFANGVHFGLSVRSHCCI